MEMQQFENIKSFLLSGKAKFTVESLKTNKHYTYRVVKCDDKDMYFVSVNTEYEAYMFIGNMWADTDLTDFKFMKSKKLREDSDPQSVVVFKFIIERYLMSDNPHKDIVFYHHGKCGRCGRKLTTPESIKLGLGPYCASIS